MSVNITVNGKFSRHSQLLNPEGYKKELENERRKLRLQQVRTQSKELARKIRIEVSEEKERQLRNLEAVRSQELNLWRRNIVNEKQQNMQHAMRYVGTAHEAAKKEKELQKDKEKERRSPPSKLRKTRSERIPFEGRKVEKPTQKEKPEINRKKKEMAEKPAKKSNVCFDDDCEIISLSDTDIDDFSELKLIDVTDYDTSSISSFSDTISAGLPSRSDSKSTQTTTTTKDTPLKRVPPVVLDIDAETVHSEGPAKVPDHIIDNHVETNRRFDSVVNAAEPKKQNTAATQTNDTLPAAAAAAEDKCTHSEENIRSENMESTPKPRYTQISDLIARLDRNELNENVENAQDVQNEGAISRCASYTVLHPDAPEPNDKLPEHPVNPVNNYASYTIVRDEVPTVSKTSSVNLQNKHSEVPTVSKTSSVNLQNKHSVNNMIEQKRSLHKVESKKKLAVITEERAPPIASKTVSQGQSKSRTNIASKDKSIRKTLGPSMTSFGFASSNKNVRDDNIHKNKTRASMSGGKVRENTTSASSISLRIPDSKDKMRPLPPPAGANTSRSISIQGRKNISYPSRFARMSSGSTKTTTTTTTSKDTTEENSIDCIGTVQFYDYNNKFCKEYPTPKTKVVQLQDKSIPNAMEQAEIEKRRQIFQEQEEDILRKKSEERGQTALEREKTRRDCEDLTKKLDELMQKKNISLPTDVNIHTKDYLSSRAALKESKINSAIEELLSRPVIITCPERRKEAKPKPQMPVQRKHYCSTDINIGSRLLSGDSDTGACQSIDTDGSGSILLGYIDDQRDQIRSELSMCDNSASDKKRKLVQLLQRIEGLRSSLLKQLDLKAEEESEPIGDAAIFERMDYEKPTKMAKPKEPEPPPPPSINDRERVLKAREMLLQKELDEVIRTQQKMKADQQAKSAMVKIISGKEQINEVTSAEKPLEIVIKVKGGGDTKGSKKKTAKVKGKVVHPAAEENQQQQQQQKQRTQVTQPTMQSKIIEPAAPAAAAARRNSYDSNSTAYQSMPLALNAATERFVDRVKNLEGRKVQQSISTSSASSSGQTQNSSASTSADIAIATKQATMNKPKSHLNPLISQYIQRLLGMTRDAVKGLQVSSSDIESPSSSVVNISTNVTSSGGLPTMLSQERLRRVEEFVNENRSFINELEESLRTHDNETLQASMRNFENVWKQKLPKGAAGENKSEKQQKPETEKKREAVKNGTSAQGKKVEPKRAAAAAPKKTRKSMQQKDSKDSKDSKKPEKSQPQQKKIDDKQTKKGSSAAEPLKKRAENEDKTKDTDEYATQAQLKQYAEMTKNCSNRIAELTALISKVRQEKQRILVDTLTSVSDNDRHSTEYAELPRARNSSESSSSNTDSSAKNTVPQHAPPPAKEAQPTTDETVDKDSTSKPLEKHKQIGRSRDSGISMPSRPVTALDQDNNQEAAEPLSFASSSARTITLSSGTHTQNSVPPPHHHQKSHPPPPTIHRYSPQLSDDDAACVHELSTIVEVDTPATSRINTSGQPAKTSGFVPFPKFEDYVKELRLDLSTMDPEESIRMEREYNELIKAIKKGNGDKGYTYEEFPTLITYLKTITGHDQSTTETPETIENLFDCLRLATIIAKPFPTHRQYLECLSPQSVVKYIDSESLENLTENPSACSGSDSETLLNIEEELKRRNLIKQTLPRSQSSTKPSTSISSSKKGATKLKSSVGWTSLESGVEKLSSSSEDSASDKFQRELLALGLKWHESMRSNEKQAAALSSSTTTEAPKAFLLSKKSSKSSPSKSSPSKSSKEKKDKSVTLCVSDSESTSERPLNLRDFLTRQLLKHVTATSTNDSSLSGESLRSQFFMAVLDSMTPSASPRTNTAASQSVGGQTNLERQKTSTPVPTPAIQSRCINELSRGSESSHLQLFSAESNLSSVENSGRRRHIAKKSKRDDKKK